MWTLVKIAWRNLFRQRRRTLITVSAMAVSLATAIPTQGLTDGLSAEMLEGITGLELGHLQVHDPAYPRGRALQSTLRRPKRLLQAIRQTKGVVAAAPRVHGNALSSHDVHLPVTFVALSPSGVRRVRFGRDLDSKAPWRADPALACEALVDVHAGRAHEVTVGTVLTPAATAEQSDSYCERIRIVGLTQHGGQATAPQDSAPLTVSLATEDMQRAFGQTTRKDHAVLRHAAAVALEGVEPQQERRVTFMAQKVVQGRYLSNEPRGEVVVGYRLARVLRLSLGSKLFVQAASLDSTSGSFYRDLKVVGIYRTGVEMIDRTRVFLHITDAQQLMGLEHRIHEIAVVGKDAKAPWKLAAAVRQRAKELRLQVAAGGQGSHAGSRPLPAPVAVYEAGSDADDAGLLIPYDLKGRFDAIPGLDAIARRVYVTARVAHSNAHGRPEGTPISLRLAGVEPELEPKIAAWPSRIEHGRYWASGSPIDEEDKPWPLLVAPALGYEAGTQLAIEVRDAEGQTNWQVAQVRGVLPDDWDPQLPQILLPYFLAQQVDAPRLNARAHELLLIPQPGVSAATLMKATEQRLAPLVRTWQQIAPDLAKLLQTQDVWVGIVMLVIFAIAALTVMNTMLMAVFERTKEFGVLKSIGMRPGQVFALITLETLAIALLAAAVGGGAGAGFNHYLMEHGLDLSRYTGGFTYQGTFIDPVWRSLVTVKNVFLPIVMVAVVCLLVSFYPAARAGRIKPVEALRHQM